MEQRIIRFKAKRLDNNQWAKGSLVKSPFGTQIVWWEDSIEYAPYVDPSTVCQFTGLKDKNGKEIWEGDYLKPIYENHKPMKVIYKHGSFCLDTPYRGLEYLPLACCDIRVGELVELEIVDRREEK